MPLLRPQTPGLREQTESRPLEPPPPQRRESPPEMAPRGLGALSSQIWACGEAAAPGGLPGRPRRPSSASRRRSLSAPQAGPEASCPGAEWPAPAGLLSCSPPEYGEASPETSPPFVSHVSTPSPRSRAGTAAVLGVEALASESLAKPGVASSLSLSLAAAALELARVSPARSEGGSRAGSISGGGAAAIHALRAGRGSAAERSRSSTPASELPSDVELNAGGSPVCGSPGGGPSEAPSRGLDGLARLLSGAPAQLEGEASPLAWARPTPAAAVRFGEGGSSSLRGRAPSADDGEASSPSSARLRGANSCPAAPGAKAAAAVSGALERIRTLAKSTSARVEAPQGMIAIAARPARPPPADEEDAGYDSDRGAPGPTAGVAALAPGGVRRARAAQRRRRPISPRPEPDGAVRPIALPAPALAAVPAAGDAGADWAAPAAGAPAGALRAVHEAAVDGDDEGGEDEEDGSSGAASEPPPPRRAQPRSRSHGPRARGRARALRETVLQSRAEAAAIRARGRAGGEGDAEEAAAGGPGAGSRRRRSISMPPGPGQLLLGPGPEQGGEPDGPRGPTSPERGASPARRGPAAPLDLRTLAASLAAAAALPPVLRRGAPADSVEVEDL